MREGATGVWVGDRKIGSIGVHVPRGVTTHGFAINVDNDLPPFEWVVPCGLHDVRMTSLTHETGATAAWPASASAARPFAQNHGLRQRLVAAGAPGARAVHSTGVTARLHAPARARIRAGWTFKVLGDDVQRYRARKPPWFKVPPPGGPQVPRAQAS